MGRVPRNTQAPDVRTTNTRRGKDLDASSRILSELATREQALDAQIEAARQDAAREIEAAEAQAKVVIQGAQEQVRAMTHSREAEMQAEAQSIRAEAAAQAASQAELTHSRSDARMSQAVETILRAVLP